MHDCNQMAESEWLKPQRGLFFIITKSPWVGRRWCRFTGLRMSGPSPRQFSWPFPLIGSCFSSGNQVLFLGRKKEAVSRTHLQLSPSLLGRSFAEAPPHHSAYISLASLCQVTMLLCTGHWEMWFFSEAPSTCNIEDIG